MAGRKPKATEGKTRKRTAPPRGTMLNLSDDERKALLDGYGCYRLVPRIRQKIADGTKKTQRFTKNELGQLLQELVLKAEMDSDAPPAVFIRLRERVVEALEADNPPAFGGELLRQLDGGPTITGLYFQFRIELLDTRPAIWRRVQLADGLLSDLHAAIQGAFGWEESHLHQFDIGGLRFARLPPDDFPDFGLPAEDEDAVLISQLLPPSGKQTVWLYTYDFGDDWRHEVLFEGCGRLERGTKYPLCLDGRRAAPPEDCGGPWGFAEILEALAHPDEDHDEEWLEWIGPYDPEKFDAKQATREMRKWKR